MEIKVTIALVLWLALPPILILCDSNFTKDEAFLEQEITSHLTQINYQPTVRPPVTKTIDKKQKGHYPVVVEVNMLIVAISSISVPDNDFTLDLLVRQMWVDKRLALNYSFDYLSIGYLKPKLWTPDLFFRNAKRAALHTVTEPNYMIWLYPNGTLKYSQKLTVTLFCKMNLWNFPLDTQTCPLQIGSYGFPIEDLRFQWWNLNNKQIVIGDNLNLNEFHQPVINREPCTAFFELTGNFSCLQANFKLQRKFGFYLFHTYLPSLFIVAISWVAFFIDHRSVPARISLGLLALLSLITQTSSVLEKLPRVSYIKAIDVWLFTCLFFVIVSLFEFAVVNCQARQQDKDKFRNELRQVVKKELFVMNTVSLTKKSSEPQDGLENRLNSLLSEDRKLNASGTSDEIDKCAYLRKFKARQIDKIFSICFPLCFLLFNIVYWFCYNRL